MGSGYKGYISTKGAKLRLKPENLMKELADSGVKYTEKDVLMVTHNFEGKLMWLEKGNESSGLKHIIIRHRENFSPRVNIIQLLKDILQTKPVKRGSRKNGKELSDVFIYEKNSKYYLVAYGNNGYIVSFYPFDI